MTDPRFPADYAESRTRFRGALDLVRARWPAARLRTQAVDAEAGLTIDWIEAEASSAPARLLIVTSGEHGVEAFVGAAMLELIIADYLPRLDPATTGLRLVHAINPWGMAHQRRVNAHNVDLNRNFRAAFEPASNPDYARLDLFLNPQRPVEVGDGARFWAGLAGALLRLGSGRLRAATLVGQGQNPRGLYYCGAELQPEARAMLDLYRQGLSAYGHILHLDMHTGYGPRYQMSLVNSPLEPRPSGELAALFDYPQVLKGDASEFYAIQGDMVDGVYRLARDEFPNRRVYATTFEFGTLGDSPPAAIRSLWAMVRENQLHWHGATDAATRSRVRHAFRELFAPAEAYWRAKALADARRALDGILHVEGFIK